MANPTRTYVKQPKSPAEHLVQLKQRGLVIHDEAKALNYLTHIGYYRLSAYFIPFEATTSATTKTHQFQLDTSFKQIVKLYVFDRKLRILILEAIERIEVSIRANWTNSLTLDSNNPHAYMDSNLFKDPWAHHKNLNLVINRLIESEELFIKHYKKTYAKPYLPPTWAMAETLSFGQISKWYANTKSTEAKKQVMRSIGLPTVEVAEGVMQCLALIRNICAHHSRLWNRKIVKQLPFIKKLKSSLIFDEIQTEEGVQIQPSRKLYNYLLVINHIMKAIQPTTSWNKRLNKLINKLPTQLQAEMGIPNTWQGFI